MLSCFVFILFLSYPQINAFNLGKSLIIAFEMDTSSNDAPYEAQLRDLFASCDGSGSGCLDRESLFLLCGKLGLEQQQTDDLLVCDFYTTIFTFKIFFVASKKFFLKNQT